MNSMNTVTFIKSFNKGQITVPKKMRQALDLSDEFWLKLSLDADQKKIIVEPMYEEKISGEEYLKKIQKIKGGWFNLQDAALIRKEIAKRPTS